jgi:hypothetical protein
VTAPFDLTIEEDEGNHGEQEAYAKGKRQETQETSALSLLQDLSGESIRANDTRKNAKVWSMNPNAVGQPLFATPGMMEFTNRKVTGFATRKKIIANRIENFTFRAVRERHLIIRRDKPSMWVVFYDPNTAFNHPDKYIVAIVSDDDIFAYRMRCQARSTRLAQTIPISSHS